MKARSAAMGLTSLSKQLAGGEITLTEAGRLLNLKDDEIRFAVAYNNDYQGDGLQCVFDIYGLDEYDKEDKAEANRLARRLLNNPDVLTLINAQLYAAGLNDSHIDSQMLHLINQHADKKTKLLAIKEYNAITDRVKRQEKAEKQSVFDYTRLNSAELHMLVELLEKCRVNNGSHPFPVVSNETVNVKDI